MSDRMNAPETVKSLAAKLAAGEASAVVRAVLAARVAG